MTPTRYESVATAVPPVVRCCFDPASPFQVGPVDFVPSMVWQPPQL